MKTRQSVSQFASSSSLPPSIHLFLLFSLPSFPPFLPLSHKLQEIPFNLLLSSSTFSSLLLFTIHSTSVFLLPSLIASPSISPSHSPFPPLEKHPMRYTFSIHHYPFHPSFPPLSLSLSYTLDCPSLYLSLITSLSPSLPLSVRHLVSIALTSATSHLLISGAKNRQPFPVLAFATLIHRSQSFVI